MSVRPVHSQAHNFIKFLPALNIQPYFKSIIQTIKTHAQKYKLNQDGQSW